MKAKKIAWDRKVNKPRLTKRVKKPVRCANLMEQRLITVAAILRTLPEHRLNLNMLHEVFGRMIYFNEPEPKPHEIKARPLMKRIARQNELEYWMK
jgi:hypothetical protein